MGSRGNRWKMDAQSAERGAQSAGTPLPRANVEPQTGFGAGDSRCGMQAPGAHRSARFALCAPRFALSALLLALCAILPARGRAQGAVPAPAKPPGPAVIVRQV